MRVLWNHKRIELLFKKKTNGDFHTSKQSGKKKEREQIQSLRQEAYLCVVGSLHRSVSRFRQTGVCVRSRLCLVFLLLSQWQGQFSSLPSANTSSLTSLFPEAHERRGAFESPCLHAAKQPPLSVMPHWAAKSAGRPAATSATTLNAKAATLARKKSRCEKEVSFPDRTQTDWDWREATSKNDGNSVIVKEVVMLGCTLHGEN